MFAEAGWSLESQGLTADEYSLEAGAVPLYLSNVELVGALSISGLDPTEDHALAIEVLFWYLGTSMQGAGGRGGRALKAWCTPNSVDFARS